MLDPDRDFKGPSLYSGAHNRTHLLDTASQRRKRSERWGLVGLVLRACEGNRPFCLFSNRPNGACDEHGEAVYL